MTISPALHTFSESDIKSFEPPMKVGLLATLTQEGLPHVTLITSQQASSSTGLMWGQFTEGTCKTNIRENPKVGFLIMTLDKNIWTGKAVFTHTSQTGQDYEMYNNIPMFRYNAYFGIHTVYYMDLIEHSGKNPLPMNTIVISALLTMYARLFHGNQASANILNTWSQNFIKTIGNLKFLSYIEEDGFPKLIPVIQAQTADSEHILFSTHAFNDSLHNIPRGIPVALFCMSLDMEDILIRGEYEGIMRYGGIETGRIKVNWAYNPMPPKPQQIYPEIDLTPVVNF